MRWLVLAYLLALSTASVVWYRIGVDVGYRRGFDDGFGFSCFDSWSPHIDDDFDDDNRGR